MQPEYDTTTALIVVDVQNDFADPAGNLSVAGGDAIVPYVTGQIAAALAAGSFVAYTQDWHPTSTPHVPKDGEPWTVNCGAGTRGHGFPPAPPRTHAPTGRTGRHRRPGRRPAGGSPAPAGAARQARGPRRPLPRGFRGEARHGLRRRNQPRG